MVIIIPFFIDAVFHESLVEARMGEAASDSASVLLTIIPSVGIALVVVLCRINGNRLTLKKMVGLAGRTGVSSVSPVIIMAYCGFCNHGTFQ